MENGSGSWDLLELGKWTSNSTSFPVPEGHGGAHQNQYQLHQYHHNQKQQQQQQQETTQHSHHHHLTCLKLGKRQYYGEAQLQQVAAKRKKATTSASSAAIGVVPRCQVEGCNKPLLDAKDYHRRHKVCELHSKSPKVVVLGAEQRFCQQCSRFHAITEFDDTKRSCRRRLAGHNERRRKSSNGAGGESITSNHHHHSSLENSVIGGCFPFLPPTSPGRALSLLSSKVSPWISTPELSSRSSAALLELIAENRAALLSRQLFSDRGWHNVGLSNQSVITYVPHQHQGLSQAPAQLLDGWNQFQDSGSHLTLDLMQTPNSTSFELLSRNKSKEDEEECCEIWKSPTLYEL